MSDDDVIDLEMSTGMSGCRGVNDWRQTTWHWHTCGALLWSRLGT